MFIQTKDWWVYKQTIKSELRDIQRFEIENLSEYNPTENGGGTYTDEYRIDIVLVSGDWIWLTLNGSGDKRNQEILVVHIKRFLHIN